MSQIARYILLFIIWFGGIAFFCLYHQRPAPAGPIEPQVIVKESESQALVIESLKKKASELESTVAEQDVALAMLKSDADAVQVDSAELKKREKSKPAPSQKKSSSPSPKRSTTDSRRTDRMPNLFGGSSQPRVERTPRPPAQRPAAGSANVVDSMTPAQVNRYLGQAAAQARSCRGRGDLVMRLTIVNSGHISRISVLSGSLKGTPAEQCVISRFKQQRLPAFRNPASLDTTYSVRL